jgi:hypothetical protein
VTGDRALAAALHALGVPCQVEARAGLALITTTAADAERLAAGGLRQAALAAAKEHGFTHLAVELSADLARASLPRR